MPSAQGPEGSNDYDNLKGGPRPRQSMECQLIESLVHHLIEKGVLTKNDALSVVQTVAEVKLGEQEEGRHPPETTARDITALAKLYASLDLIHDRRPNPVSGENILQLRPPLHGDEPRFPRDD